MILLIIILILKNTAYSGLIQEINNNNYAEVKKLIEQGADVNQKNGWHRTALVIAIEKNNTEIIDILLKNNADINAEDEDPLSSTALETAVYKKNYDLIKYLLEKKVKKAHINKSLMFALNQKDSVSVGFLLDHCSDINDLDKFKQGLKQDPVYYAIQMRDANIVRMLIKHGADLNHKDRKISLLSLSVDINDNDIFKLLIENGADVNGKSRYDTIINEAIIKGNLEMVSYLYGNKNLIYDNSLLLTAIEFNKYEIACYLVEKGFDVNYKDKNGNTLLMNASMRGNYKIAKLLTDNKCDTEAINRAGETALFYTSFPKNTEIADLLLEKGTSLNYKNNSGMTPLMSAAKNGFKYLFLKLLEKNADTTIKDKKGNDALYYANLYLDKECVDVLSGKYETKSVDNSKGILFASILNPDINVFYKAVGNIVDINFRDENGGTALISAVKNNNYLAVSKLLQLKTDLNLVDKERNSALMYSAEKDPAYVYSQESNKIHLYQNDDLIKKYFKKYDRSKDTLDYYYKFNITEILLSFGADVNIINNDNKIALDFAVKKRINENIELLEKAGSKKTNPIVYQYYDKILHSFFTPTGIYYNSAYYLSFESGFLIALKSMNEQYRPEKHIFIGSDIGITGSKMFAGFHKRTGLTEYTAESKSLKAFVSYNWSETDIYSKVMNFPKEQFYYGIEGQYSFQAMYLAMSCKAAIYIPFEIESDLKLGISLGWGI